MTASSRNCWRSYQSFWAKTFHSQSQREPSHPFTHWKLHSSSLSACNSCRFTYVSENLYVVSSVMTQEHYCKISPFFGVLWQRQLRCTMLVCSGPTCGCLALMLLLWSRFLPGLHEGSAGDHFSRFYFLAVSSGVGLPISISCTLLILCWETNNTLYACAALPKQILLATSCYYYS